MEPKLEQTDLIEEQTPNTIPIAETRVEAEAASGAKVDADEEEEEYEPTSLSDALKIGLAYLTFTDVILYCAASLGIKSAIEPAKAWGWQTDESIDDDDFKPSLTTIPFGPYMVGGVIIALFYGQALIDWYLRFSGLGPKP